MNTATKIDLEDLQSVMEALQKRFGNMTLQTKVDVAARLKAAAKVMEVIDAAVKDEIKLHLKGKAGTVNGEIFKSTVTYSPVTRLDQKLFKEKEPKLFAKYERTNDQATVRFEAR